MSKPDLGDRIAVALHGDLAGRIERDGAEHLLDADAVGLHLAVVGILAVDDFLALLVFRGRGSTCRR